MSGGENELISLYADKARLERCLDAVINMVRDGTSKPDRSWAGACRVLFNRLDEVNAKITALPLHGEEHE